MEKDGSISGVNVIKMLYPSLDDEAVRVVQRMPKWKPGTQNGQAVRVQYNLPIHFEIPDDTTRKDDDKSKDSTNRNSKSH